MKAKIVTYIFIFILSCAVFECLFPYPIFSAYTNITESDMVEIAKFNNTENGVTGENETKVLTLDWNAINSLIEIGQTFEVVDVESGESFSLTRTGGTCHADVECTNYDSAKTLFTLFGETWQESYKSVWVKINDTFFVAGALSGYPHGYTTIQENGLTGHLCLYFKNSSMNENGFLPKKIEKLIDKASQTNPKL